MEEESMNGRRNLGWVAYSCVFSLFMSAGLRAQEAAKHPITFDDLIRMHRVSETQVSPDGKWVAYTVATPELEANRNASDIWMVPTGSGAPMQLTRTGHDSSPVWSPDGKQLAFLSSRDGNSQVHLLSMESANGLHLDRAATGHSGRTGNEDICLRWPRKAAVGLETWQREQITTCRRTSAAAPATLRSRRTARRSVLRP